MAALTWREVTAPQMDTRGLAQAGQSVTGAFDKLGQMFVDNELKKRVEATDAAKVEYLRETDPAKLAAMLTNMGNMPTGPNQRVNMAEVLQGGQEHRTRLITAADAMEDMLNKQAAGKYGKDGMTLMRAALDGNADARAEIEMRNQSDPLWARYAGTIAKDVTGFDDDRIDNVEGKRASQATEANGRISANASALGAAASMRNADTQARNVDFNINRVMKEDAKAATAEARALDLDRQSSDIANTLLAKGAVDTSAITVGLKRTPQYNALKTEKEKTNYISGVVDRINNKTQRSVTEQETLGMPHFSEMYKGAGAQSNISRQVLTQRFNDSNPYLAISEAVAAREVPATEKEAMDLFRTTAASKSWMVNSDAAQNQLREAIRSKEINPGALVAILSSMDAAPGMFTGISDLLNTARRSTTYLNDGNPLVDRGQRNLVLQGVNEVDVALNKAQTRAREYMSLDKPIPKKLTDELRQLTKQAREARLK